MTRPYAPIVLYLGPSVLDGAPIVAIATVNGANVKTGPMVQTWIMRSDVNPMCASDTLQDASVCGSCPRRRSTGGDCYVNLGQAPLATWRAWDSKGRPGENWTDESNLLRLTQAARDHGLRLGSYGDPASVPWTVWADVMAALAPRMHTGYTHQWKALGAANMLCTSDWVKGMSAWDHYVWCSDNLMASCDSPKEAAWAQSEGWRTFTALAPEHSKPNNSIECLADREVNPKTCETCGICDGTQGKPRRTSVYLLEHGPLSTGKHRAAARSLAAIKPSAMVVL